MRTWQAIPVAAVATLLAGVALFTSADPLSHTASAAPGLQGVPSVRVDVDCDTATAGIQTGSGGTCSFTNPTGVITRTIAVIATNTGPATTIAGFNFDLYNPVCGGTGATAHPQGVQSISGCTISAAAKGIFPNSIPNIAGTSTGFPNLTDPGWTGSCVTGGDFGDSATGSAGTSTSLLSCFNPAGDTLAAGASVILGTVSFTLDEVASYSLRLTLSNVSVANKPAQTLAACDPVSAPPAAPGGTNTVSGPCTGAVLNFTGGSTATPTGPTATPVPPTVTPTPCTGANCPTPTSQAFVTVTPNSKTLTAVAPTKGPATPPPAATAAPGGPRPPTGTGPGGGTGAGGARPITLPDTGAGAGGGLDWLAAGLLALLAVAIGGGAGAFYLGAAHVAASRRKGRS